MPRYAVKVTLWTEEPVEPELIAEHVATAAACWGGQYHPEDPLFSAYVEAKAICRGEDWDTRKDGS